MRRVLIMYNETTRRVGSVSVKVHIDWQIESKFLFGSYIRSAFGVINEHVNI